MAKSLNVLFISSEVEPFAKTGGLADVSGALPLAVKRLDHDIRVMLPMYGSINERKSRIHEMLRMKDIEVPVGTGSFSASVKSSFLTNAHGKVQVYLLENQALYGREGLYVHPETNKEYPDNDDRFIFFCRGVLEMLKRLAWQPDIIHCNDWPTGLVPAYLKTLYRDDPFYRDTRSVLTIHNMAYQGIFPKKAFPKTLLPPAVFTDDGVAFHGNLSFLKAGLVFADALTTVSEKYADEIASSEEFGAGLQDVAARRKGDLTGILNGIEYAVWDPGVDPLIPYRYDSKSLEGKEQNTAALLARMGLPRRTGVPVVGIISRLADQKGFDLIGEVLDDLIGLGIQLVILGTGDKKYHELFLSAVKKHPEQVAAALTFDNALAHLIEAGSDMFLMPSRYEPCGLNQIYSLRYGTIPIVRATGGLDDTIDDYNSATGTGTGFKFTAYDGREMLAAVKRAVTLFNNKSAWQRLMKNGMAKDFSWDTSAKKYVQLYRSLSRK
jgi:starch synthase